MPRLGMATWECLALQGLGIKGFYHQGKKRRGSGVHKDPREQLSCATFTAGNRERHRQNPSLAIKMTQLAGARAQTAGGGGSREQRSRSLEAGVRGDWGQGWGIVVTSRPGYLKG